MNRSQKSDRSNKPPEKSGRSIIIAGKIKPGNKIIRSKKKIKNLSQDQEYKLNEVSENTNSYTTRLRAIGNSRGVILNNELIKASGLRPDSNIVLQAREGVITIIQLKDPVVNTDISTWDKQFKAAIKRGAIPERDLFKGVENDFDKNEW